VAAICAVAQLNNYFTYRNVLKGMQVWNSGGYKNEIKSRRCMIIEPSESAAGSGGYCI